MSIKRYKAASIVFDEGNVLWVTGGSFVTEQTLGPLWLPNPLNTTDYVALNGSWPGPDLPFAVYDHCLAKVSSTKIFLIGGKKSGGLFFQADVNDVLWSFDISLQKWTLEVLPRHEYYIYLHAIKEKASDKTS